MFLINGVNYGDFNFWINFAAIAVLLLTLNIFYLKHLRRIFITATFFILTPVSLALFAFGYTEAFFVAIALIIVATIVFTVTNIPDFRPLTGNPLKKDAMFLGIPLKGRWGKKKHVKIYDRDAVFHELENAIDSLTKTKTGALITIERTTPLDDVIRNGTIINAAVSSPLLLSIFYKGTVLHDGAVIIRDNMIIAASVYFPPSTKPLAGKVGSRHRAALGISEISDSVTIVVSEETGRISIAYKGLLQSVPRDNFIRILTDYVDMGLEEKEK
ncbi:MAG TPA: DNA integrity scanning protein DisA nucleotide-binding domain protein [Bacilli bacterium]|nr:DNA integrity scanning protein DisA nucleotide-binding domain protein [Bacilli bacterium]